MRTLGLIALLCCVAFVQSRALDATMLKFCGGSSNGVGMYLEEGECRELRDPGGRSLGIKVRTTATGELVLTSYERPNCEGKGYEVVAVDCHACYQIFPSSPLAVTPLCKSPQPPAPAPTPALELRVCSEGYMRYDSRWSFVAKMGSCTQVPTSYSARPAYVTVGGSVAAPVAKLYADEVCSGKPSAFYRLSGSCLATPDPSVPSLAIAGFHSPQREKIPDYMTLELSGAPFNKLGVHLEEGECRGLRSDYNSLGIKVRTTAAGAVYTTYSDPFCEGPAHEVFADDCNKKYHLPVNGMAVSPACNPRRVIAIAPPRLFAVGIKQCGFRSHGTRYEARMGECTAIPVSGRGASSSSSVDSSLTYVSLSGTVDDPIAQLYQSENCSGTPTLFFRLSCGCLKSPEVIGNSSEEGIPQLGLSLSSWNCYEPQPDPYPWYPDNHNHYYDYGSSSKKMSTGGVVLLVLGVLIGVCGIVAGVFVAIKRIQRKRLAERVHRETYAEILCAEAGTNPDGVYEELECDDNACEIDCDAE